jgi:hypothetical protein
VDQKDKIFIVPGAGTGAGPMSMMTVMNIFQMIGITISSPVTLMAGREIIP